MASGVAPLPRMVTAGSPGSRLNMMNVVKVTANMTGTRESNRKAT